jgi:uncharacterized membrane protein
MGSLGALLSAFVLTDIGAMISRLKRNAALSALAGLLFLTGYIFALVAGAIYLSRSFTPLQAVLIIAAAAVVLGLLVIALMSFLRARDERRSRERRRGSQAQTSLALATALSVFQKRPLLAAGFAVGIGAALGLTRKGRHRH